MKRFIEYPLAEGGSIVVEVDDPDPESGMQPAGRLADMPERVQESFEAALERIKPAAVAIITTLRGIPQVPDEISVDFGITMNAKAGAVLAAAEVEANYHVSMTWRHVSGPSATQSGETAQPDQ